MTDPEQPRSRGRPRGFNDKTEQNTIKSLDRAMGVLEKLARLETATLSTLARSLGESPATVYRILITLQNRAMVELEPGDQTWHIGSGAFLIGSTFLRRTSLIERARPVLRELMQATGETANLGIEEAGSVLFVSQVETHSTIRAFFPPGTKSQLHASGIGKVLLANLPAARIDEMLGWPMEAFTDFTLDAPERLRADLDRIRRDGYSVDNEERNLGMRCIAAPIWNAYGEAIAGISVSGPTSRVGPNQIVPFAEHVKAAARKVSQSMGARVEAPLAPDAQNG